ncbi:unnamed protein product [Effrenium voratum]|nr:unnamed protein product [Effrenium voratum]
MAVSVVGETSELGPHPAEWQPSEVGRWLQALGLEEAPERAMASGPSGGAQLMQAQPEELLEMGQVPSGAELAEAWTHTLAAAHKALLSASEDVMPPVGCWEQLQVAFPSIKRRLVPLAESSQLSPASARPTGRAWQWSCCLCRCSCPSPKALPSRRRCASMQPKTGRRTWSCCARCGTPTCGRCWVSRCSPRRAPASPGCPSSLKLPGAVDCCSR